MRKVKVVGAVYNRYLIAETTSGSTNNIYLSDGEHTIMLEDCLIWEDSDFTDEEFYDILGVVQATTAEQRDGTEYEGWHLIKETV
jgi:hypothetical protein